MRSDAILSVSPNRDLLGMRERALRAEGFEVVSVRCESAAMFEIEMGLCGVIVLCHLLHEDSFQSLSKSFRTHCSTGTIIAIMDDKTAARSRYVDICVEHSEKSEKLVLALLSDPGLRELAS